MLAPAGALRRARRRLSSDAAARGRCASSCSAAGAAAEITRFFEDEIRDPVPRLLRAFLEVQQLRGFTPLAPDDASLATGGLHPLIVPLVHGVAEDGEEIVQGVMRMPPSVAMGGNFCWPLVEASVQGSRCAARQFEPTIGMALTLHFRLAQPGAPLPPASAGPSDARQSHRR